ncbi:hypothetical protein MD484_g4176, partial [Candolleomyces efflorescens]
MSCRTEDMDPLPPSRRGRPKGSKDGPRPEGAPPRGRPKKRRAEPQTPSSESTAPSTTGDSTLLRNSTDLNDDDEYFGEDLTHEYIKAFDELTGVTATANPMVNPTASRQDSSDAPITRAALDEAVRRSHFQPFFTSRSAVYDNWESDTEDEDEAQEEPVATSLESGSGKDGKPWFRKPATMPDWLYQFFGSVIRPIISRRVNNRLARPQSYETGRSNPASFWVMPPDPAFMLLRREFDIKKFYQPRIYLWLPHFFVEGHDLMCPKCKDKKLEKNGPTPPRRIVDVDDNFWMITWQYYCRKGCKSYYSGWSTPLLDTLPRFLQLSFPAVLSRRGGVSHNVISTLRVANQHKMGPSGVRSLLVEQHTLRYNRILLQYLEGALGMLPGPDSDGQSSLHSYVGLLISDFGDFWDRERFGGFVPTDSYLAAMMNRAIEKDEAAAAQHTALLAPDQIAIDDSHKITKHIAKVDSVPVFTALWTAMDSRYVRAQVLTLTKAHEERLGPLTDDPVKDKSLLFSAFPSLAQGLTPVAHAYGLSELVLPPSTRILTLESVSVIESTLSSILDPLDVNPQSTLIVGFDAEWNICRTAGVSIIQLSPQSRPDEIYIIPVHKLNGRLPPSLLRILISPQVYKVGSAIKADLTRLKKQFLQLSDHKSFKIVDLKDFCIQQGVIERKGAGSLDVLLAKLLNKYLSKDETLRKCDLWELHPLRDDLRQYAALDAYASRLIFEEAQKRTPPIRVTSKTIPGTRVVLYTEEGGFPAAFGSIADSPPAAFQGVRVKTPSGGRVLIEIDKVLLPSAGATLHLLRSGSRGRNKAGTFTLSQLQKSSGTPDGKFRMVAPPGLEQQAAESVTSALSIPPSLDDTSSSSDEASEISEIPDENDNPEALNMLEAFTAASSSSDDGVTFPDAENLRQLEQIVASPPDSNTVYTRIKKDIFHGFHSLPLSRSHGSTVPFLRTLRDHILRWDPKARKAVDEVCRREFNLTFDGMLLRSPRFVTERTPRYIPSPSVLVLAIQQVYRMFSSAKDAKSGEVLFTPAVWEKANALLELARQGYFSDLDDVPMYEKAGVDKYGLQKWKCLRGTNNVEGGPHGDIYRKFGALNAGPRFTVNCLTDHRTFYNLQAFAAHLYNVDWEYHHSIPLINRTSFLLNYLSDVVGGAQSYQDWVNGDLYEQTSEVFGISPLPESLRIRYSMEPHSKETCGNFPRLNASDDWLRSRQGLALPVVPPTTLSARKYFFTKLHSFSETAIASGKKKVDFEAFSREWNRTADGMERFYITPEVLSAYAKSWEKVSNIRASQELLNEQMVTSRLSTQILAAETQPFPPHLTASPVQPVPLDGLLDLNDLDLDARPESLMTGPPPANFTFAFSADSATHPAASRSPASIPVPQVVAEPVTVAIPVSEPALISAEPPSKRRRIVASSDRSRRLKRCRRCNLTECPGMSDIRRCKKPCTTPCKKCLRTAGCMGVDNGRKCTFNN